MRAGAGRTQCPFLTFFVGIFKLQELTCCNMLFWWAPSSNCPKCNIICSILFKPHTCTAFLKYALITSFSPLFETKEMLHAFKYHITFLNYCKYFFKITAF